MKSTTERALELSVDGKHRTVAEIRATLEREFYAVGSGGPSPYPMHGADWITPTPISMLDDARSVVRLQVVRR